MIAFQGSKHTGYLVLATGTSLAVLLASARAPMANWALDGLSGLVSLVGAAIVGTRLFLGPTIDRTRPFWQLALALLLIGGLSEFSGPWAEYVKTRLGIDDANDGLVLFAALVVLWFTTKLDRAPTAARWLLWTGFALHFVALVLDVGDTSAQANSFDLTVIESATDLFDFLALQFYLLGAVLFIAAVRSKFLVVTTAGGQSGTPITIPRTAISTVREREAQAHHRPLGLCMRRDFSRYIARGTLRGFFRSRIYVEGARPVMFVIRTGWCLKRFGHGIAAAGRPFSLQAVDMLRLGWRDGIDPILYPTLELYRPERYHWINLALSRFEVKSGMLRRLHKIMPKPHGERVNLGDKLAFHVCCRRYGLPSPQILIHATGGTLKWMDAAGTDALDRNLFIKPRQLRGARNSLWLRRVAPLTWQTQTAEIWTSERLLGFLQRRSRQRDMLVQEMLVNHPLIADLADQSLIAIRVITAIGPNDAPEVTHAMLRVLSKLEPDWHSKREHAARVDLRTGIMDRMCNDKDLWPGCWSDDHPVTEASVAGRELPYWSEIHDLALKAHRVFADRMLVGWDIALTSSGAVLLEGNSYPDVHFLQRVHGQPIGLSRLGPLLQKALDAARIRDRHMIGD